MTFRECINKVGIIEDCATASTVWGTYEVQFVNSATNEADHVTFDVIGPATHSGNDKCEELFKDFCKTEGIHQNSVTEIHITRAFDDMSEFGEI